MRNFEIKNIDCRAALEMTKNAQSGRCLLPESGADAPVVLRAVYTDSTPAKNRQADVPQYGRSMIEMLGVLAIIGVLSVGGIAGYSKAMMIYRINKTIEQVAQISTNVRTFFSSQREYDLCIIYEGSDKTAAQVKVITKAKLVPDEMLSEEGDKIFINNSFGGTVELCDWFSKGPDTPKDMFGMSFYKLPQEACIELATLDWGSAAGAGLISVTAGKSDTWGAKGCAGEVGTNYIMGCPNGATVSVPIPLDKAATACDCDGDCIFSISYY